MSSDQLAKLQEALIEGRIDKETYETLKADILAAKEKSPPTTSPAEPPVKKNDPWVRGRVILDGAGGTVQGIKAKSFIEVYLDDELIGDGTANAGFHITFETTVGSHSLTLKQASKGKGFLGSLALVPRSSKVFPLQFDEPGDYQVNLGFGGWTSLGNKIGMTNPDDLPAKIEIVKSEGAK